MLRIPPISIHCFATTSEPHKFNILRLQEYSSSHTNATKSISKFVTQDSFAVGYLMNEFGFPLEKAVLASKRLHFENRDKPDAVVSFFKNQGFTHTQIQKVISAESRILVRETQTILLPKIEFFKSKGISSADLAKMVVLNHHILTRSLKDYIIPTFNSLIDLIGSDELVIDMLKRDSRLLKHTDNRVKSNIAILRGAGVSFDSITHLLKNRTVLFCYGPDKLKESIKEVQRMGMDPRRSSYKVALSILTVVPKSKLDEKMEAYRRWGCSADEVLASFKIQPCIMSLSVGKIDRVMSFCVNEMGWEPSEVVKCYFLLTFSLNKRIVPRWSVYQELVAKGLVKEEGKLTTLFALREDAFLDKYVNCYKTEAPLLFKLYREKLEASK